MTRQISFASSSFVRARILLTPLPMSANMLCLNSGFLTTEQDVSHSILVHHTPLF